MLCWIVRGRAFVEGTDSYRRTVQKTEAASKCSKLAIINIRRNLRRFGSIHAPQTREGRKRTMTPLMIEALCHHPWKSLGSTLMRWLSSSGMSSKPWSPPLASDEPLLPKVAPRRPPGNVHEVATAMETKRSDRSTRESAKNSSAEIDGQLAHCICT